MGCCSCCPNFGIVLAIFATLGIFYSLGTPDWSRTSGNYGTPEYYERFQGLWMVCDYKSPGALCQFYRNSFLSLSVDVQVMRIMTSVSAGFAVLGLIIGMFGLNCGKVVSEETRRKCTGRWGSTIMLLAGALCCASVTWCFINNMNENNYSYNSYVTSGTSIYVGWGASGLAILAGLMGCCNCTGSSDTEEKNGYIPLRPDILAQMYPFGTNAMLGAAAATAGYKPPITGLAPSAPCSYKLVPETV